MARLSILIPMFDEEEFIEELLTRVLAAPLPEGLERELIVVNDCSRDRSAEVVKRFVAEHMARPGAVPVLFIEHAVNQGKGAAIRTAIQYASGEFSLIQDADLEYDPQEYPKILRPLIDGKADAVFGSRFMASGERRVLYFWHQLANQILTLMANLATNWNMTDMETCYKAFRTSLLKSIPLRSNRFGMEPEITIKLARRGARLYETPISYDGRTYDQGKKIGLKDAFDAVWVIVKYSLANDLYTSARAEMLDAFSLAPNLNRWMADTIAPYIGKRVLDIGAGIGNLARHLTPGRDYYIATDLYPEHLESLRNAFRFRKNVSVQRVDAESNQDMAPFRERVDTVLCLNVIEHVPDEVATLSRIHDVLEPGGAAIVLVPCGMELYGTLDEVLEKRRRYTRERLRECMEQAGFTVERIIDFNRVSHPGWYVTGKILKRKTLPRLSLRIFNKLVWLWRKIDDSLPWEPTSIIAIGRKR